MLQGCITKHIDETTKHVDKVTAKLDRCYRDVITNCVNEEKNLNRDIERSLPKTRRDDGTMLQGCNYKLCKRRKKP